LATWVLHVDIHIITPFNIIEKKNTRYCTNQLQRNNVFKRLQGTHFAHARVTHHVLDGEHVYYFAFVDTAFGVTCNTNHNNNDIIT